MMKKLGWFFFLVTVALSGYFSYFFYFKYIPEVNKLEALTKENQVLRDSLLKLLPGSPVEIRKTDRVINLPYEVKYRIDDFFSKNSDKLTDSAIKRLREISGSISVLSYDTVEVVLYPGGQLQTSRALALKRQLISFGLKDDKVFARVSRAGEKDIIIIRVK